MKKFISLMLAGLLSASLFAFGASAAKEIGGDNGVNDFESKDTGKDINVKVEDVTHMYAVDLTFSFDDLSIGNWEWNVNTMKYDIKNAPEVDTNITRTIEVSNRSDLPVYAYGVVNDSDANDKLAVAMTGVGSASNNKLTVGKATAGTESDGKPTNETLMVSLSSTDWNAVAQYYINKQQSEDTEKDKAKTYTVATVTVTICKAE